MGKVVGMCPLGILPPWPQLVQGWASDISQDNQQPSLECVETKTKEWISFFWWERWDLPNRPKARHVELDNGERTFR